MNNLRLFRVNADRRAEIPANKLSDSVVFHIGFIQRAGVENVAQKIAFADSSDIVLLCVQNRYSSVTVSCHDLPTLPDGLLFVQENRQCLGYHYFRNVHVPAPLSSLLYQNTDNF